MIIRTCDLDMVPGGQSTEVRVNQYDEDFQLRFSLHAHEGTFTIEAGATAAIRGTKPDGNGYSANAVIDVEAKTATIDGDQQLTAVAGRVKCELTLYSSEGKELNTANFTIRVERAALDKDSIVSESKLREFVAVQDNFDEILAAARTINAAVIPDDVTFTDGKIYLSKNGETIGNGVEASAGSPSSSGTWGEWFGI